MKHRTTLSESRDEWVNLRIINIETKDSIMDQVRFVEDNLSKT